MNDTSLDSVQKKSMPNWIKTGLAILVSLGILAFYFKDIDWLKFNEAISQANLWMAFFSILIPQILFWILHVYQVERMFAWFHGPFPLMNFFWVRGGLFLVMMFNSGLGSAANILYLQQKTQVSWLKFISISFFRVSVQVAMVQMLLIVLTILMHIIGVFDTTPLNPWMWWLALILGQLTFWDAWFFFVKKKAIGLSRYFFTSGEKEGKLIGGFRNKKHEFWQPFYIAKNSQWLFMMFLGLLYVLAAMIGYWYFVKAFNIEIPALLFISTIILVVILQDLPIAFASFGATTVVWSAFYGNYSSPEAIASMTLCMPLLRLIVRALIGAVSMKPAISDISKLLQDVRLGRSSDLHVKR